MSYYIDKDTKGNPLPAKGKAQALVLDGAKELPSWPEYTNNLICVINLGPFDIAKYMYDKDEYTIHINLCDHRTITWLTHPHAKVLCGFSS